MTPAPLPPVGSRWGRLVVAAHGPRRRDKGGRTRQFVFVTCSCGAHGLARADRLRDGTCRSCGCLKSEESSARMTARRRAGWGHGDARQARHEAHAP